MVRKTAKLSAFPPSSNSGSHHGIAVLNFRNAPITEYGPYGEAFHMAGQALAQNLAASNGYSDLEACPIVFLYRHALELFIKGLILTGNNILHISGKKPLIESDQLGSHRLSRLLPSLKQIFDAVGWKWELDIEGIKDYEEFQKFIEDFEQIDPFAISFRYPTDKQGKAPLPKHFAFNVVDFSKKLDPLLDLLV